MINFLTLKIARVFSTFAAGIFAFFNIEILNAFLNLHVVAVNHLLLLSIMIYAEVALVCAIVKNIRFVRKIRKGDVDGCAETKIRHALQHRVIYFSMVFFILTDFARELGLFWHDAGGVPAFNDDVMPVMVIFRGISYVWVVYFSIRHLADEEANDLNY